MEYVPIILYVLLGILVLITFARSFTVAKGNEIILLERRWFGKQMPDGRTVALSNEVGVQARVFGPGVHFILPYIYKTSKHK